MVLSLSNDAPGKVLPSTSPFKARFLGLLAGQDFEILWVPQNVAVARKVIERLNSKEGLPWHLTQSNCEMVVRWAVENRAVSHQVGAGVLAALGIAVVVAVVTSGH